MTLGMCVPLAKVSQSLPCKFVYAALGQVWIRSKAVPRSFVASMWAGRGNNGDTRRLDPAKELATSFERAHRSLSMPLKVIKHLRLDAQSLRRTQDRFFPRLAAPATGKIQCAPEVHDIVLTVLLWSNADIVVPPRRMTSSRSPSHSRRQDS